MELGSASSTSPDSPNGLKFGEKVYFEHVGDVGAHHKSTTGSPPVSGGGQPSQSPSTAKKGRGGGLVQGRRCQVEGCETDLSDVKAYYSRHKVCGAHSKSPMVIVAGLEQRFCQQCSRCVRVFRTDNGGEFFNANCHELFTMHGIIHQRSYPYTPQQNGVVERKHRHLLETARAIKFQGCLPSKYWGECVEAATYIINRIPLSILGNKSPYELFYGKEPSLSHTKVIGCLAFATNLLKEDKFAPKVKKTILLGYAVVHKGYKLLDIKTNILFVSRDVKFDETIFPFQIPDLNLRMICIFLCHNHLLRHVTIAIV
ncbi:uncharacterized protein LOC107863671 isoform X2 [Capsicum annuum]|uniref:uncharacterized protein LOC107863671 isoform X2 n=1 Tax=Capsicum annuum TaxID=4072 RepID=UPI001FB17EC6|nr:uncharacterized protein LOC107863671 isoform X2 [Capsicum annuum]